MILANPEPALPPNELPRGPTRERDIILIFRTHEAVLVCNFDANQYFFLNQQPPTTRKKR